MEVSVGWGVGRFTGVFPAFEAEEFSGDAFEERAVFAETGGALEERAEDGGIRLGGEDSGVGEGGGAFGRAWFDEDGEGASVEGGWVAGIEDDVAPRAACGVEGGGASAGDGVRDGVLGAESGEAEEEEGERADHGN